VTLCEALSAMKLSIVYSCFIPDQSSPKIIGRIGAFIHG
jgi:hypothetical protein